MTSRRITTLAAAIALVLTACGTTSTASVEIPDSPSVITVTSGAGNVTVTASDAGAMVTAEISASGEEPDWSAELVGSELVVDDGCGDRTDCTVDLIIEVAGTADVVITSTDGVVAVVDMNSSISITGVVSNVALNGITGPIDVNLTSGDVLGARLISTTASFLTGDGDLDVTLTETFESLTVVSENGDVTAQVPQGGYDIDAVAVDGEVAIDVDDVDGASAVISIRSAAGDVTIYRR